MSDKDNVINLPNGRNPFVRDALIADLLKTRVPVSQSDLNGQAAAAEQPAAARPAASADLLKLLRTCVSAMEMQVGRECGELHINRQTARKIWDDALLPAKAAIAYHDERANDIVIDIDAEEWKALKRAIQTSPRFRDMYEAGGMFTDAVSSVHMWLAEVDPEAAPQAGGPGR